MNGNCLTFSRNRRFYCYKPNYVLFPLAHSTKKYVFIDSSHKVNFISGHSACVLYRSTGPWLWKLEQPILNRTFSYLVKFSCFTTLRVVYNIYMWVVWGHRLNVFLFYFLLRQQMSFCGAFISFRLNITSRKWNRLLRLHADDSVLIQCEVQ